VPSKDARLAEQGRRGARIRWARTTQAERDAASAVARAAIDRKYVELASAAFGRLGIEPSLEQLGTAATRLRRADLAERLVLARAAAAKSKAAAKRTRDTQRAAQQVKQYAEVLRASAPRLPDQVVTSLCIRAADEELRALDGYQPARLTRRLQLLVEDWKGVRALT